MKKGSALRAGVACNADRSTGLRTGGGVREYLAGDGCLNRVIPHNFVRGEFLVFLLLVSGQYRNETSKAAIRTAKIDRGAVVDEDLWTAILGPQWQDGFRDGTGCFPIEDATPKR